MNAHERIGAAISAAHARGEPAVVAYLTAGFPSRERFQSDLRRIAAAADVIEIGVPFTDPMADGMTIQRSSRIALEQGVSLRWILEELAALAPALETPLLLMSYLNPLLAFGLEPLARAAERAAVAGLIVPDLPFDEGETLHETLAARGLALVQMVTPVTPEERLERICARSQGFLYAVTSAAAAIRRRSDWKRSRLGKPAVR